MNLELSTELRAAFLNLGRCLVAMGEYRKQSVLAGGLAAIIYRYLHSEVIVDRPPLPTFDADLGLAQPFEQTEAMGLKKLMKGAGFEVYTVGKDESRADFYQQRDDTSDRLSPFHVEFLSHLPESDAQGDREGRSLELQPQLFVQALPFFELLFQEPLTLSSAQVPVLETPEEIQFQVANPAMYIVQKILAQRQRLDHKKGKDLAYVYDVILLHRSSWPELAELWSAIAERKERYVEWIHRARNDLARLFESETADGPVSVINEFSGVGYRELDERTVTRVVQQFLAEMQV